MLLLYCCCYYVPIVIYYIIIFLLFFLFLLLFQFLLLLLLLTPYSRASSLALLLPDWTPLGLYHLRLDHPGLGRSGSVPEGFHRPQGEVASGNCTPWGHHMQCLPRLVLSSMFYFTRRALPPRSFPKDTCFFPVPAALPHGISIMCLTHPVFENPFSAIGGLRP